MSLKNNNLRLQQIYFFNDFILFVVFFNFHCIPIFDYILAGFWQNFFVAFNIKKNQKKSMKQGIAMVKRARETLYNNRRSNNWNTLFYKIR